MRSFGVVTALTVRPVVMKRFLARYTCTPSAWVRGRLATGINHQRRTEVEATGTPGESLPRLVTRP
eukprot:m.132574 g.132574  ORF g.132574 m.132574 type:complete len:66 (+) comp13800_c0_seq2:1513-1710(+)